MSEKTPQQKAIAAMEASKLEQSFEFGLRVFGPELPKPEREYRFHPERQWRLDFAWPDQRVGVEIQGGTYRKGGHSTGAGIRRDQEKLNAAQELGWRLLQFDGLAVGPRQLPTTIETVRRVLSRELWRTN